MTSYRTQPCNGWTDNDSVYTAHETRKFARELNLEPRTAVISPQSNGMAERFVKTMKENYIAFMEKLDAGTGSPAKPRNRSEIKLFYLLSLL